MANNKVVLADGTVLMDTSGVTVDAEHLVSGYTALDKRGVLITGVANVDGGSAVVVTETDDSHGGTILEITAVELTGDTVTPSTLLKGITAHNSMGQAIVGTHECEGGSPVYQSKTATPSESQQTVLPDDGYDALSQVTVNAVSNTYVGSGISRRTSSNLTVNGATVTAPAGYYSAAASKSVTTGTAGTPTATKGDVSNHSVEITPSVTNTTGYITGGTKTGTVITVTAAELESGTKSITSNGTGIDVSGYSAVDVNVPSGGGTISLQDKSATPSESVQTITADSGYDGLSSVTVGAIDSEYVGSDVSRRSSSDLTASEATVSVPAGYYAEAASKAVSSGSAATPATTITANPSITVSSAGLITATVSGSKSVTPTVSAGYVSSGTAGTVSVSGSDTEQLTVQAAKTVTPTKSSQTAVAAGRYTTGAVTVAAIPADYITTTDATATASDINSGATAYINGVKVTGTQVIQTYYTGSSAPSASLGSDGDIYLEVVS